MERRIFGKTGLEVSPLGFGAAPVGYLDTDRQRTEQIVQVLIDGGVNLFDTAASYRGSEALLGQIIGSRRDQLVLVSKCGRADKELTGEDWSPALIAASVDRSLKRLQVDHLDVMLLHSCDLATLKQGDALGALIKAKEQGKVRHIGYSGDNEEVAYAAALPEVAVVEMSVNICDQANLDEGLLVAHSHNVGVLAKRPIANAAWKEPKQQQGMYQNYAQVYHERLQSMNIDLDDLGLSGDPAKLWPEVALRFTLSQPGVSVAIIGTTNPDNARANIEAAEKGPLTDEQIETLREAFGRAEAESGEMWSGQT